MEPMRIVRLFASPTIAVALLSLPMLGQNGYLKHDPPPDANKPWFAYDDTCWLATAANVLAGAGYGTGSTEQERAEEIYDELKAEFGYG